MPTGTFADLVGRRASLIVANILGALDMVLFLHPTPPLMILSFALSGTAWAFRGGAGDAILWGIAAGEDVKTRAAHFSRLYSLMFVVATIAELIGAAAGGFMGHALIAAPFAAQFAAYSLGCVFLLQVPEQRGGTGEERVLPLRHIMLGLRATRRDPLLLGLLVLSALVECAWTTTNYYTQLYMHVLGYSLSVVGVLVALALATSVAFTALTPRLMRRLPGRWLVPGCFAALVIGLLLLSAPQPAMSLLGYLLLFPASVAVLTPALSTYINARCPEAQRATVLSFQTGMFSMAMIVLFPLFGLGVVTLPFALVYRLMALGLSGSAIVVGWLLWPHQPSVTA